MAQTRGADKGRRAIRACMDHALGQRLALTLELAELARATMLARWRVEHPDATEEELQARFVAWVVARPMGPGFVRRAWPQEGPR